MIWKSSNQVQMMDSQDLLRRLADDFASVIPEVDTEAEHERWQAGIGPFEEDNQVEMLRGAVEGTRQYSIRAEELYLNDGQRCDLFIKGDGIQIPVEAKLLQFCYDNERVIQWFPTAVIHSLVPEQNP